MQRAGIRTTGVDPTEALLARAMELDPQGDYRLGRAETMDFGAEFDLVVSYLSLIDMPDLAGSVARMVAALRPGGTLLIANLTSFNTAGPPDGCIDKMSAELMLSQIQVFAKLVHGLIL